MTMRRTFWERHPLTKSEKLLRLIAWLILCCFVLSGIVWLWPASLIVAVSVAILVAVIWAILFLIMSGQ